MSTDLRPEDFDYYLPSELIAYTPVSQRDESRMLVLNRKTGNCEIRKFKDLLEYVKSGDCIVINNSKVIKARIYAFPIERPEKKTEFLLLEAIDERKTKWKVLAKPRRNLKKFKNFCVLPAKEVKNSAKLYLEVISFGDNLQIEFKPENKMTFDEILEVFGHVPLPPYIKRQDEAQDIHRYQTVYAETPGSIAAPTAGLHFTEEILAKLTEKKVKIAKITLHIGAGTFAPVRAKFVKDHKMHTEKFTITEETAKLINSTRKAGGKILAVGTTTIRAMESALSSDGEIISKSAETDIFIYPPYQIKCADMLLTNFHLPKSTLIMLVCAFAGKDNIMKAYQLAIKEKFRFYSYGDCMLII